MPQQLSKGHKTLQRFGVYSKIVYDASTDYFMGIRFTNKIEKEERRNFNLMPSEDSLSFYIRKECVITPFDDTITSRAFTKHYMDFCHLHTPGGSVPVTKRALEKLGVKFSRFHVSNFECRPYRANESLHCVDFNESNNEEANGQEKKHSFSLIMDFVSVALNLMITCIIPLPMLAICLLTEIFVDEISPLDADRRVSYASINTLVSLFHGSYLFSSALSCIF